MTTLVRPDTPSETNAGTRSGTPRKGSWWRKLAFVVACLLVLVLALPWIVAHSKLRNFVLGQVGRAAGLRGTLTAESASLGWFSTISIRGLRLADANGKTVASVQEFSSDRSLLRLALRPTNLGTLRADTPDLNLVIRRDGSNLEDVLGDLLRPSQPSASKSPNLSVVVVAGRIAVRDQMTKKRWRIDKLSIDAALASEPNPTLNVDLGAVFSGERRPGKLRLKMKWQASDDATSDVEEKAPSLGDADLALEIERLPLGIMQTLLRRVAPGTELTGNLSANLKGHWDDARGGKRAQGVKGRISGENLDLAGPWLGADRLQFEELDIPCEIVWKNDTLRIDVLQVACDAGQIACQGTIPRARRLLASESKAEFLEHLSHARGKIAGEVDLAELARLLPDTLRIRPGTDITSGRILLDVASVTDPKHVTWNASLEATRLVAIDRGREIVWDQPLRVNASIRRQGDAFEIPKLTCESDFLRLSGAGTRDDFQLQCSYDLTRLAKEVSRFADLGDTKLAGKGTAEMSWQLGRRERFQLEASLNVQNLELARPGASPWFEQQLSLRARGIGRMGDQRPESLQEGSLELVAGSDRASLRLAEPVKQLGAGTLWPLALELRGQLARWLSRAEPWIGRLPDWELDGNVELTGAGQWGDSTLALSRADLTIEQFRAWGGGFFIDEPRLELGGSGRCKYSEGTIDVPRLDLKTTAAAGQVTDFQCKWAGDGTLTLGGQLDLTGELGKLEDWLQDPVKAPTWRLAGRCRVKGELGQARRTTTARLNIEVDNLVVSPQEGRPWNEPRLELVAQGSYNQPRDHALLDQFQIKSKALQLQAKGDIERLSTAQELRISGRVDYDLETIQNLLRPYVGNAVTIRGRESRPFELAGPLSATSESAPDLASRLQGKMQLGWEEARLYGLPIGATELTARLSRGQLQISPLETQVAGGQVRLAPGLRLSPEPMLLSLEPGQAIDHVNISTEMCNKGLKFVAPALADATEAEGQFSMELEGLSLPLSDPRTMDAAGKLTVHTVEIGPSAVVQEMGILVLNVLDLFQVSLPGRRSNDDLAVILGKPPRAKLRKESEIPFKITKGRVYHRDLELAFNDVTIRTYGSVGLDESLAMMVELVVQSDWLKNPALQEAFEGQTVKIPIGGTLSRPKLDRKEMDRLAARFVRQGAESVIRNEIGKQLDRLFKPPK